MAADCAYTAVPLRALWPEGASIGTTVKDIAWRASERGTKNEETREVNLGNEEPSEGSRTKSNERRNEARQGSKVKPNSKELDISSDNIIFFTATSQS
jgi:hypothetical protein